ncbi:hypothetical protein ACFLZZ_04535 [Nanoarchaeota archaeon]
MVNESIVGGLKNAASKGQDVQQAAAAYVNAGYNRQEVGEALKTYYDSKGKVKFAELPRIKSQSPVKKKKKLLIGGIVAVGVVMLILLALLLAILFE